MRMSSDTVRSTTSILETPPGSTYEHTDANVGIIVRFVVWLAVSAVVIHVGLGFLYQVFIDGSMITDQPYPLAVGQEERLRRRACSSFRKTRFISSASTKTRCSKATAG